MQRRNRHRFAKRDANQQEIAKGLRQIGCRVIDLSHVGDGCPDLLIGFRGQLLMLEVKAEKGKLTPAESNFMGEWEGHPVKIVRTVEEAIAIVGQLE